MFRQTVATTHNIGGNFNVAKDSEQTHSLTYNLERKIRVKLGCGFISQMCVGVPEAFARPDAWENKMRDESLLISQNLCSSR